MNRKYVLKEGECSYYVSELNGSTSINDAMKFTSILDMINKVPMIMRDWNWDYKLYMLTDKGEILVDDFVWMDCFNDLYKK